MSSLKSRDQTRVCPETSRPTRSIRKYKWLLFLYPFIGLAALIWFLVRVIPKPSRASYPCQRVAFPLASGFIIWVLGIIGSAITYRKAKNAASRAHYVLAAICITASIGFIWTALSSTDEEIVYANEPIVANHPLGVGKGVHPGRVAWIHDPNATSWPGSYGYTDPPYWHSDTCTDQSVVNEMLSKALQALAGRSSDAAAWDDIFKSYNQQMGKGNVGYTPGEKIAIKVNFVLMYSDPYPYGEKPEDRLSQIDNSPQLTRALLKQLTDVVGVSPNDISIGDPLMMMPNHWYDMVHAECPDVVYLTKSGRSLYGRTQETLDYGYPLYFNDPNWEHWLDVTEYDRIPSHFRQAEYFINFAILKSQAHAGITLSGKNNYGSLMRTPDQYKYFNMHLSRVLPGESPGMGHYRAIVDLMGHPELGAKTILVLIDGLYSGRSWDSCPIRWDMAPFNGHWPSSIFLSQDPVAADSVGFDFMYYEWDGTPSEKWDYPHMSGAHDYLHEAALIPDPCSGSVYDPTYEAPLTESLGVHEHWNNATDKQYTRNLDPVNGTGIELVTGFELIGDFFEDGVVNSKDFTAFAAAWGSEPGDDNWNADCDISVPSDNVIDKLDLAVFCAYWLL
jgi:hypothetical protein